MLRPDEDDKRNVTPTHDALSEDLQAAIWSRCEYYFSRRPLKSSSSGLTSMQSTQLSGLLTLIRMIVMIADETTDSFQTMQFMKHASLRIVTVPVGEGYRRSVDLLQCLGRDSNVGILQ